MGLRSKMSWFLPNNGFGGGLVSIWFMVGPGVAGFVGIGFSNNGFGSSIPLLLFRASSLVLWGVVLFLVSIGSFCGFIAKVWFSGGLGVDSGLVSSLLAVGFSEGGCLVFIWFTWGPFSVWFLRFYQMFLLLQHVSDGGLGPLFFSLQFGFGLFFLPSLFFRFGLVLVW